MSQQPCQAERIEELQNTSCRTAHNPMKKKAGVRTGWVVFLPPDQVGSRKWRRRRQGAARTPTGRSPWTLTRSVWKSESGGASFCRACSHSWRASSSSWCGGHSPSSAAETRTKELEPNPDQTRSLEKLLQGPEEATR